MNASQPWSVRRLVLFALAVCLPIWALIAWWLWG